MQAENWQRVRALFDTLVDQPPESWEAALDQHGLHDPDLREEVLTLLRADSADLVRTVIDAQIPEVLSAFHELESGIESERLVGRTVGAFRLIEQIGRGGMGTVWRADRVDGGFEQSVAIKLIRAGWDAQELIGRFRAERQILANLNHPNIAHLVDGGVTDDALPWLALEYVDGTDLRSYCDENQLGIDARLKLFLTVCAAVSHAHAHLVVHRDLKPSNLMVTRRGEVKLLDFGIAKLVDHTASHASLQRVFTPEYAAPEQVRGEAVTTAVDVYALGLLLYELLTGRRPYNVKNSTPAAYERAILDQEPTRPSLAFSNDVDSGDLATRAAGREMSPQQMRRELRGDLDAIILKALRKPPEQRYASVADLAADVENHL
ncbi:MAG: serine/threonine-protein kinase, partial [Dokdonella sp.]